MTGSLAIKNGKYYAVLNVYEMGVRKKKWICSNLPEKGNKRKAELFLYAKIKEFDIAGGYVHNDVSFSDYVRSWLVHIERKVDTITFQGYKTLAEGHILPYFDKTKDRLCNLTYQIIQQYIDFKHREGRLDGKGGLSPTSLKLHKNVINQTLNHAVKHRLIPSNPCQFVDLPRIQRYESSFYNARQITELFRAFKDEPILPLIKITAFYGLRRSELLGLQWDSIDFEGKTMTIKHTVTKVTQVVAKDRTKNAASHRSFPLTDECLRVFQQAKDAETQNRKLFGKEYQDNTYVFKWPDGHPYAPDYISRTFRLLLKKHNLPPIRFHELRHSCASLLLSMGMTLKDVQEWLGHSDIKMTANIYSHLDNARKIGIADAMSDKLQFLSA